VTLVGVQGLEANLERVDASVLLDASALLRLGRVNVQRLEMSGVQVKMTGSAPALGLALSGWAKQYARAFDLRCTAEKVSLSWRTSPNEPAWLEISGGSVDSARGSGTLRASQARLGIAQIGLVGAVWTKDNTTSPPGSATLRSRPRAWACASSTRERRLAWIWCSPPPSSASSSRPSG